MSRWLAMPLALGVRDDAARDADDAVLALESGALAVLLPIGVEAPNAGDGESGWRPLVAAGHDDIRFAGVVGELVRVIADLSESAGLPAVRITPGSDALGQRRELEIVIGALGAKSVGQLADSLLLFRAAVELCVHARGLVLEDPRVRVDDRLIPLDGRVAYALAAPSSGRKGPSRPEREKPGRGSR